jgi:hypothetical protein
VLQCKGISDKSAASVFGRRERIFASPFQNGLPVFRKAAVYDRGRRDECAFLLSFTVTERPELELKLAEIGDSSIGRVKGAICKRLPG